MPDRKKGPSPKMHARASSPREQAFPVVGLGASAGGVPADAEAIIEQLAGELRTTREHLKATAEQYHASNEELSSSNEELQSINEELRSTTEEIVAVNREFEVKIEELARANSDLQNLMAATEIGTIFLSRDLCIERFTPPVEQLFNITTADVGRPLAHFTHTLGYPELLDEARQVLHRLGPVVREVRSEAGRWYLVRLRPYRMAEDRVDGVVITFVDFAERRQAEATSQRLAAIVESSEDAIIGITLEGVITSWNRGAVRMYGYAAEDAVGKPITLVVPAERQEEVARFLAVIKRGEWVERVETVRRRRDGSRLEVSLSISPVYDRQGMLLGASTIARDITERKEAEAALRESEQRFRVLANAAPVMIWRAETGKQCT